MFKMDYNQKRLRVWCVFDPEVEIGDTVEHMFSMELYTHAPLIIVLERIKERSTVK